MSDHTLSSEHLDRFGGVGRLYGVKGLARLRERHASASGALSTPPPPFASRAHPHVTMGSVTAVAGAPVAAPASLRRRHRGAAALRLAPRPVASQRRGMSE